jgi:hypothetical protein
MKCGFCNAVAITSMRDSMSGVQLVIVYCGSCQAVLGPARAD